MAQEKYPIYLLTFPTQHLLCSTFLRFQEHYESPKYRGQVFSLEEFMDWYANDHGAFTYLTDWAGFNIPSRVLRPFREGLFGPLTQKEQALLDLFRDVPEPFYVIGTYQERRDVLAHEFVHGLFTTVPGYADDVQRAVSGMKTDSLNKWLAKIGYHPEVFVDETNAYLLTGLSSKYTGPRLEAEARKLGQLYKARFGWSIRDRKNWDRIDALIHRQEFPLP
jgi:hypothetical protein